MYKINFFNYDVFDTRLDYVEFDQSHFTIDKIEEKTIVHFFYPNSPLVAALEVDSLGVLTIRGTNTAVGFLNQDWSDTAYAINLSYISGNQ
jgi:hypothetical protein